MASSMTPLRRSVLALVLAGVLAPAFAGYAAAAACAGGGTGMPCCRRADAVVARFAAGCCRVQQDRAPVQPAVKLISTARVVSIETSADVPTTAASLIHERSSTFTASPPGSPSTPLYVRLSSIRR
jgi:hypothetical protein